VYYTRSSTTYIRISLHVIIKVLGRIGEVNLRRVTGWPDFAEMGELVARCLGYPEGNFTETYNRNIGFKMKRQLMLDLLQRQLEF